MAKYRGIDNKTGEVVELTERQVRDELIETFQHDMGTCAEYSDEEIEQHTNENAMEDMLDQNGEFEGWNYKIEPN